MNLTRKQKAALQRDRNGSSPPPAVPRNVNGCTPAESAALTYRCPGCGALSIESVNSNLLGLVQAAQEDRVAKLIDLDPDACPTQANDEIAGMIIYRKCTDKQVHIHIDPVTFEIIEEDISDDIRSQLSNTR